MKAKVYVFSDSVLCGKNSSIAAIKTPNGKASAPTIEH